MQPLYTVLLATVFGLICAPFYSVPFVYGGSVVVACLVVYWLLRNKHQAVALVLLFVSLLVCSNLRYQFELPSRQDVITLDKLAAKATISGQVADVRQLTDGRTWLLVKVESIDVKGNHFSLEDVLPVRLYLGEGTDQLFPGDVIQCQSRLRKPRLFGTPGEFNWPRYLASQHTAMTGWIKNLDKITILNRQNQFPARTAVLWRSSLASTITDIMAEDRAYMVRALVLGEGRVIPTRIRKILAKSGISHLFAISGLHLGMIGLLGYKLLLPLYCRFPRLLNWQPPQRVLPLLLLPLLFGYLLLTGDAVSTRRAFALAAVGTIFLWWRYYVNPLLLLASLAFISLQVNPLLLWQAGWHLSFIGAAGIILWKPLWQSAGHGLAIYLRYPLQLFLVTFVAMLATLPLVLVDFHLFAPAGVVVNLLCVPLITLLALPIGFAGLLLFPLVPQLSIWLLQLCGLLLDFVLWLAEWFVGLPGFSGSYLFLSNWQYLAIALAVLPLLLLAILPRKKLLLLSFFALFSAGMFWQFPQPQTLPLTLTMFSVGQGESMLLRNNSGQTILVDGGGFYSDRFDVGERLLAPALGSLRVKKIDVVILSHDDIDHRKGLIFILNNYSVGEFWIGNKFENLHYSLREALVANEITVKTISVGWSDATFWRVGNLKIFNGSTPKSSSNDSSLVVHLSCADNDLLLTGDLEEDGVRTLLSALPPKPISLLKLPHHGSRFSLTDKLVDQFKPKHCLVSSGYQNRYHLPAQQVVEHLQQCNIPLYRTDQSGTLQAQLTSKGWQVRRWYLGDFR